MANYHIFLEGRPAPLNPLLGYGHYYLVKRAVDEFGVAVPAESDLVIRGGPGILGAGDNVVIQTGSLKKSEDAYEDTNGDPTHDPLLAADRYYVHADLTDTLLAANPDMDVQALWDAMAQAALGVGAAEYDYELPDYSNNHLANSNAVILTVLNAVNFDVRAVEDVLDPRFFDQNHPGYVYAGATQLGTDSDPTILGQGDIPEISASAALTAGVAMLGRGDVSDFFIGTRFEDRYYGYQEFEISFLTVDTVSFERLVEDVSLGELGLTIRLAPKDLGTLFKPEGIEVAGVNFNGDGSASAESDFLHAIERVELTHNPDRFEIDDAALDADILVDMGASRRTQAEIDALNAAPGPDDEPYELEPASGRCWELGQAVAGAFAGGASPCAQNATSRLYNRSVPC